MSRIQRVREFVEQQYQAGNKKGVVASQVADALSIWRNDASSDLNQLVEMGVLQRSGKKPVVFSLLEGEPLPCADNIAASAPHSDGPVRQGAPLAFANVIGCNGSLKPYIQLAKSAVSYRPSGLHMLIHGKSGVGKSMFAEETWRYACESNAFGREDVPFETLNCAEYADNPHLLLSQLFGHVKGAFTGATEDKQGLVERADGGLLFLDEIHRLTSSGQELLFPLLDKKTYRRLGDVKTRTASVMLIGATSEDITSSLILPFKRRIPIQFQLPPLESRPLGERIAMIRYFFSLESDRLDCAIWISEKVMLILASYMGPGNIGELRNVIQTACAKSYLSYLSNHNGRRPPPGRTENGKAPLSVDVPHLSQAVYLAARKRMQTDLSGKNPPVSWMVVRPGEQGSAGDLRGIQDMSFDLYALVENSLKQFEQSNLSQSDIESIISSNLEQHYGTVIQSIQSTDYSANAALGQHVDSKTWKTSEELLRKATQSLHLEYSSSVLAMLALHLQQFVARVNSGQIIYNPNMQSIRTRYATELSVLEEMRQWLEQELAVSIPDDELGFIVPFLRSYGTRQEELAIGMIVVAKGNGIASGIAEYVNHVFSTTHVHSVNISPEKSIADMLDELYHVIRLCTRKQGIILFMDETVVETEREQILGGVECPCAILPWVNTQLIMEAYKAIRAGSPSLLQTVQSLSASYAELLKVAYQSASRLAVTPCCSAKPDSRPTNHQRKALLVICSTGVGGAEYIKGLLQSRLDGIETVDIITASIFDDIDAIAARLGDNLKLVIGVSNPNIEGVPFYSLDIVLSRTGMEQIQYTLFLEQPEIDYAAESDSESRQCIIDSFSASISYFAPVLDGEVVLRQCLWLLNEIESKVYKRVLPADLAGRILIHSASMMSRLAAGEQMGVPISGDEELQRRRKLADSLTPFIDEACKPFGIQVDDAEKYFFLISLPESEDPE